MPVEDLFKLLTADMSGPESKLAVKLFVRLAWRITLMIFIAFAMGWLSFMGVVGFARADEVDKKLSQQVAPLQSTLAGLVAQQKVLVAAQQEQTAQSLKNQILEIQSKKCRVKARGETAELYMQLQRDAEEKYYAIKHEYYKIPSCSDL